MTRGRLVRGLALALLLAALGAWFLVLRHADVPPPAAATPQPPTAPVVPDSPAEMPELELPPPEPSAATLEQRMVDAQQDVVSARAARSLALAELSAAEAEMEPREEEVAELERFIADLEARGEDPAEHAEEGLALFNPALESYQRTALRLELAHNGLKAADEELRMAEQALAALSPAAAGASD